jgi:hypothetical protein
VVRKCRVLLGRFLPRGLSDVADPEGAGAVAMRPVLALLIAAFAIALTGASCRHPNPVVAVNGN